jgi:SAM-dependent methyltransferase
VYRDGNAALRTRPAKTTVPTGSRSAWETDRPGFGKGPLFALAGDVTCAAPASLLRESGTRFRCRSWGELLAEAFGEAPARVLDVGGGEWSDLLAGAGHELTVAGEPSELPYPSASFDAVLVRQVLPRLRRPHRALKEWIRVLRTGGRLVLVEGPPARPRSPWRLFRRGRERRFDPPPIPAHRAAPFRGGLSSREAVTLLSLADLWDVRCYDLGELKGGDAPFVVRARKP